MNTDQLHELLYQALETEQGDVQVHQKAVAFIRFGITDPQRAASSSRRGVGRSSRATPQPSSGSLPTARRSCTAPPQNLIRSRVDRV
jgi:hypothetical protein